MFVQCFLALVVASPNYTTDQSALLAFKSHIPYDPNNILASSLPVPDDLFHRLPKLTMFFVSSNEFFGEIPLNLGECRQLQYLSLSSNEFIGFIPRGIGNLTMLKKLDLCQNNLQGEIPPEIGNLGSLEILSLGSANLTGSIPSSVFNISSLKRLGLSDNQLFGSLPKDVCNSDLPSLEILSLARNQLMGSIPRHMGNCHKHIVKNQWPLDNENPISLLRGMEEITAARPKCWAIWKSRNAFIFSGKPLNPKETIEATSVGVRDYLLAFFKGEIPSTIGGLLSLEILYLDLNRLEGSIPQTFGRLISMESLDISHNNLTGVIPKSLEALLQLKYFNVSFNRLTGEIPSGGPFDNLTNESFLSNEALCSAPRFIVPPCHLGSTHQSRKRRLLLLTYVLLPIASILFAMAITFASKRCRRRSENHAAIDMSPTKTIATIGYIAPEYGLEGLVSTRCDMYSFGIMLMETFTRTKPTDAMFDGDLRLKNWVDNSMADGVAEIIDANLLRPNEEQYAAKIQCVSGIMELALRCSAESPEERMNMKDVLVALKKIKLQYLTNSVFEREKSTVEGSSTTSNKKSVAMPQVAKMYALPIPDALTNALFK
ncbi:hypothetical protein RHSIM_Rhsim13G0118600 [Rhododendron simsii]|uniref:Serine-threonine/tyrosine-protein kinase catalytic domain-containing protein n=1 Tax=Rhododendron simsii TaxID=118357 RepID=A0A834L632_RHOSS|nr:hypothetical protein RHSIM_Rhsim13G0118600 [Rhododendron simsii]